MSEPAAHRPYVRADDSMREFTFKALALGILFGIVFGAANAYLEIGRAHV